MKVCVFCGSGSGKSNHYLELGTAIGKNLAEHGDELVYGGASIGVMGAMADACLEAGGTVYGIMPSKLVAREVCHSRLTHFEEVHDMHIRKRRMYELSDAFVALPGGMGTLDEFCEIFTWAQIEYHAKPIILFNHHHFFDLFISHIHHAVDEGFMKPQDMQLIRVVHSLQEFEKAMAEIRSNHATL